ncbi:MAG: heme lyase CcmF/NrfE family subunit, partial [Gammaproteobacteria bacterium]|nr:heme lyase CcmF/NrfE family subunit [Gammaproteobacteria bacterium]
AFAALVYAFITNDFSVSYVANNSNTLLPVQYRISAVWGAHEGSLLLWVLILGIWMFAVTIFNRGLPKEFVARVLGVMGLISLGFLLFLLLTSNPFERILIAPQEGADLNPLLQDPGLIIHPPMLYTGYVGFSVAFSFAIAALLGGQLDIPWARWARPWTIISWVFLTLGIALGSWWAYYELGWGGWWFWDPVENASFMPWLAGTALIHSLAATDKRDIFKNWTILLAICTFSLSLLGTFIVRSGVLTSVHAFASDPTRGVFILVFLGLVVGGSLLLYAVRAPAVTSTGKFSFISRDVFLLINSVLLVVVMLTILLGTLYPLVIEAMGMGKLSGGAPYFNAVFVPLMIPVTIALGFGIFTNWRKDKWARIWSTTRIAAIASIVLGGVLTFMLVDTAILKTAAGLSIALWIFITNIFNLYKRRRMLTLGICGMSCAHIGIAITIIGITVSSNHSQEIHKRMGPGDRVDVAGYTFELVKISELPGPNYQATEALINVYQDDKLITTLRSQKRIYFARGSGMPMTEAGIDAGLTRDIYVSLGEPLQGNDWSMRFYHKPFIRWIWLGALFMALGGILAATDKRFRLKKTTRLTTVDENATLSTT